MSVAPSRRDKVPRLSEGGFQKPHSGSGSIITISLVAWLFSRVQIFVLASRSVFRYYYLRYRTRPQLSI